MLELRSVAANSFASSDFDSLVVVSADVEQLSEGFDFSEDVARLLKVKRAGFSFFSVLLNVWLCRLMKMQLVVSIYLWWKKRKLQVDDWLYHQQENSIETTMTFDVLVKRLLLV